MKLDTRQVRQNVKLDQLGTALNVRLDTALNLINDEITLPLRMIASDTPNLVLNIGPISIKTLDESTGTDLTALGHKRTRTIPPINGVLPVFTGATVTFPSASGGSISSSVTLVGGPYTLTVASGNWIKVGISLTETGGIYLTFGTAAATEAAAGLPDFNTGYFPVGYVSLQNVGGTIQTVTNARIYQFIGGSTGAGGGSSIDRVSQAAHGFVVGDLLYLNGSTYAKASAAAGNTAEIVGIVSKITSSSAFELTLLGEVSGLLASSFDSGALPATGDTVFLSATAGKLTVTEPSVVGQVSLPVGVMSTANSVYFKPSRGVVIGGANVRTQIGLANAATTTIQNASAYSAGELSGWVFIDATTDLRFYIQAQFAKNGAGTNYNLSYQTTGDTPPAGFNISITTAGVIQVTLPSIGGYSTASINFALNAPAVGATLPLSIDSSNVSFSDIKAASSAGITFKEDGGNTTMVITDAGSVGIGTASPGARLDIQSANQALNPVQVRFNTSNDIFGFGIANANGFPYIGYNTKSAVGTDIPTYERNNFATQLRMDNGEFKFSTAASGTAGNAITFTERVRVDSTGRLLVNPSLTHNITSGIVSANGFGCRSGVGGSASNVFNINWTGSAAQLWIDGVNNGTISLTSDYRIKKNVETQTLPALERIAQLRPIKYEYQDYKEIYKADGVQREGFIAHELQAIIPSAVEGEKDAESQIQSLKLDALCSVMVKAIQEQQALIEKLEARIAALETK